MIKDNQPNNQSTNATNQSQVNVVSTDRPLGTQQRNESAAYEKKGK